jgi:vacuolar-type H+-ATPase subunit F/Vma7
MAQTVKLLSHQARFVQAPYVFPDTRFFILCGGFACGKTSSLVYAVMHAIKLLLGKKDKEGHNPKIMVCSKNITFLAKTWTNAFEQNLKMTNSEYTFDRAKNIIVVGNVELILVPTEEPANIYGYSCFRGDTLISTDKGEKPISAVKEGDFVLTTEGFKKVLKNINQGVKDCIKVTVDNTDIYCTSDHRFIDEFNNEIEAKDLTKTTSLVKVDTKKWRKWLDTNGRIEQNLRLLTSMVSDITDTRNLNHTEKGAITPAQMKISKKVSRLYTEICGLVSLVKYQKDMMYITKTETLLTILLRTLNLLQEVNTLKNIGGYNQKKKESNLLKQLKKQEREIKNFCKTLFTERKDGTRLSKEWKALGIQENVRFVKNSSGRTAILQNIVDNVLKLLKKTNVVERIGKTLKHESVLSVNKSSVLTNTQLLKPARLTAKTSNVVGQYTVYDLCVEGCHEFFANGVRVHNCALAVVDELDELPTGIAMEAVKSINDRVRQQIDGFRSPFICFATTSQGLKGLYQTVLHFQKAGIGYLLMRARTRDNTYLPADYVKNMYSIYNEKEVACLLEGQFVSIDSGLVFPDYDPKKNKLDVDLFDSIADDDTVYIGQDFNCFGNHAVALVVKKFTDGKVGIVAIKDYVFTDIRRAPEVFRYDYPTQRIVWIPDMTYKEHFTEFKKELRIYNIKIAYRSCNPLVNDRVFACNKLFYSEHLFITPICKNLEKALLTHQRDPKTGAPMKGGVNAPDHDSDAFGMAIHYLLSWNRDLKGLYDVTLNRLYSKRRARGADATELEIDTRILSPDKLKSVPLARAVNVNTNAFNPSE